MAIPIRSITGRFRMIPPNAPTVSQVTPTSKSITGKTEAKATVYVVYKKKTYATKVDTNENYRGDIASWERNEPFTVLAKDATGNKSKVVGMRVAK